MRYSIFVALLLTVTSAFARTTLPQLTEASGPPIQNAAEAPTKTVMLKGVKFPVPAGWTISALTASRASFLSTDKKSSILVISYQTEKKIETKGFELLTDNQIEKERKVVGKELVRSAPAYMMMRPYYGGPRKDGRGFAGYMRASGNDFILILGESEGSDPKEAMAMVSDFIQGFRFE